jgi:hypothetical protein
VEAVSRNVLQTPIVNIIVLGALLGVALVFVKGPPTSREDRYRVVITASDLDQLRGAWIRRWQREPTLLEFRGILEDHIREEVLYREAVARGYDRDDVVVRRAMQRKMEFLGETVVERAEITDEEIRAYFSLRTERYRVPPMVSFVHVYFSTDARGERAEADAQAALAELRNQDPALSELGAWGDRFMLHSQYVQQSEQNLRLVFGRDFAAEVIAFEPGVWRGPVLSGYGLHLVRVSDRTESYVPELSAVKERVRTDMEFEARNAAKEQLYQEVLRQYQVVLDEDVHAILEATKE